MSAFHPDWRSPRFTSVSTCASTPHKGTRRNERRKSRMQRILLAAISAAFVIVPLYPSPVEASSKPWTIDNRSVAVAASAQPSAPPQNLPPGAIKHPGERCGTTVQPPDGQGCPQPSPAGCVGTALQRGECTAAVYGFFNPPYNFQPRNAVESCIARTENGNSYDRSPNPSHEGRWQVSYSLHVDNGGQPADWGTPPTPAEQDYVFANIVRVHGYAPWRAFDGC